MLAARVACVASAGCGDAESGSRVRALPRPALGLGARARPRLRRRQLAADQAALRARGPGGRRRRRAASRRRRWTARSARPPRRPACRSTTTCGRCSAARCTSASASSRRSRSRPPRATCSSGSTPARRASTTTGGAQYFGRDGKPLARRVAPARSRPRCGSRAAAGPSTTFTAAYRVEDPEALTRVLDKLRGQGLEPRPIDGIEDARSLAQGVAVVGGDTLVAVLADDGDESDRLLRERLGAAARGPELPALEDDLVAVRAAPTLLGAVARPRRARAARSGRPRGGRCAGRRRACGSRRTRRAAARASTSRACRRTSCRWPGPGRWRSRRARASPARRRTRA